MKHLLIKVQTAYALGLVNLWRAYLYRLGVKLRLNPVYKLNATLPPNVTFFDEVVEVCQHDLKPNTQWVGQHSYFSWFQYKSNNPPQWHLNPFNGKKVRHAEYNWWNIADFDPDVGDIKTVWEASRFDWVLGFAQLGALGDEKALKTLNYWLNDWCNKNPPYKGPNWKCGQESSIRVMHLSIAASILNQYQSSPDSLIQLIEVHLKRIAPTISYAIAQNNNHGTSEAAALFMGGSWLHSLGRKNALKYKLMGIKWLENRAKHLIADDGTFSQYSVNYHRLMLDTYSMVEYWRRLLELPEFSLGLYARLQAATNWLFQMIQAGTGDAPNLGANDGARLLPLIATNYRDYRPCVQLASNLFCRECAYDTKGDWNIPIQWLKIKSPDVAKAAPGSNDFSKSGYSLLRKDRAFVLFNIPRFKFRPSQADALHIDLWFNCENLLRDGGTYSYNAGDKVTQYFGGTASHNTVQFDNYDQMPRLSRFLLGAWIKLKEVTPVAEVQGELNTAAAYCDYQGAYHHRSVKLTSKILRVIDTVLDFKEKAVLRWRLKPGEWVINTYNSTISDNPYLLNISSNVDIVRFEIVEGWESRFYMQKTRLPVLEVEIGKPGVLTTEFIFIK